MTLKMINGLEYNGSILYGIDESLLEVESNQQVTGAIHTNLEWYELEENRSYIFLGEDELCWYVMDKDDGNYRIMSKPSGDYLAEYSTFSDILDKMLEESLL